jgi:autotransporter-associated beta strand protein
MKTYPRQNTFKRKLTQFALPAALLLGQAGPARAAQSTWTGGAADPNNVSWSAAANWQSGVTFGAGNTLYFSGADPAKKTVRANNDQTIGALIFGPETAGANAISVIGNAQTLTLSGVLGSDLGLSGNLATANVGLLIQAGAGANGFYANNTTPEPDEPTKSNAGVPILVNNATTFVNASSENFYLDARLTGAGALTLQGGKWVIDYQNLASTGGNYSTLSGGLILEDTTLTVNVASGTTGGNTRSPLGQGTLTLGNAGSDKDATFVFTSIDREGTSTDNRLTTDSGNFINVSAGTGKRVIQNGSTTDKQLYSRINLNTGATLTLDNANLSGAVFTISAQEGTQDGVTGVGAANDLNTGLRGTGDLYLTGGGLFLTRASVSTNSGTAAANGVRNSFTGVTTIHSGTLQFLHDGGFQATSRIQVDKDGVLDVSLATNGTYTLGNYTFSGSNYAQTLAGTGQVLGTLVLGEYSTLRPGGVDEVGPGGRSALSFANSLDLGPLTIIDLSSSYFGAVDTLDLLGYGGELRLTLANGYTAEGAYDLFDFSGLAPTGLATVTVYSGNSQLGFLTEGTGLQEGIWSGNISGQYYEFTEATGILNVSAVPEPSSVLLAAAGLAALLKTRRSRRA